MRWDKEKRIKGSEDETIRQKRQKNSWILPTKAEVHLGILVRPKDWPQQ
jgi:hypothetical protein